MKQWNTPQLPRQLQLRPEDRLLRVARREIVVVVEPDLADGAGAAVREAPPDSLDRLVDGAGKLARLVWMDARREPHGRPGPSYIPRARSSEPVKLARVMRRCEAVGSAS